MITLHGTSHDGQKKLLTIGICDGNIAMLKAEGGMRIVTPEGLIVDIIYGPTETDIIENLKQVGLLTDQTEVAIESPAFKPSRKLITPDDAANN